MRQFLRKLRMELARQAAVVLGDLRAGPTAAGVAQERKVLAARESQRVVKNGKPPELDEMVATPARAELCPGAVLQSGGHARRPPIGVHDVVLPSRMKRSAHPKPGFTLERPGQT